MSTTPIQHDKDVRLGINYALSPNYLTCVLQETDLSSWKEEKNDKCAMHGNRKSAVCDTQQKYEVCAYLFFA